MGSPDQPRDSHGRWTETGALASMRTRAEFFALRNGRNSHSAAANRRVYWKGVAQHIRKHGGPKGKRGTRRLSLGVAP